MKRLSDFVVSLFLIVILAPIMLIIGLIIKLDSPGPAIYCRRKKGLVSYRIGRGGKIFHYFKFRSMYVGTEDVTPFGYFIRRWHLDELPELFLVLNGNMSLVGPRPWLKDSVKRNRKLYYESLRVRPGITGPTQINRHVQNTLEEVISLNHWYADNQGFITDIGILLKTPFAIFKQREEAKEVI